MKVSKKILTLGILFVVLVGVFMPTHVAHAGAISWVFGEVTDSLFKGIGQILMGLSSLVLIFSGMILDWILKFTIVDMAKNIGTGGVADSITLAWATLRDVANMCFIFVLLFAAFKAMFSTSFSGLGTTITNIIIVALLINFSLFFSKVVIDASNIVSVGFYNSITSSNTQLKSNVIGSVGNFRGISGGYMNMLGMQTLYSADILNPKNSNGEIIDLGPGQILVIGIMSSVFMLITAVILAIAAIMFAARFIILIFLMILSPLALIAYIIPGMQGKFNEWKDALISQSFFAPLFFALTWVVFKLGTSLITTLKTQPDLATQNGNFTNIFNDPGSSVALLINYVLIIGFSIAALVFSKQMASKGATAAAFKGITGGIGTGVIGGAALAGRNTIGRVSGLVSEKYRDTWSKSTTGRAGLWLADKGKRGSFDVRATDTLGKVPGLGDEVKTLGKAGGKGGFATMVDTKVKAKAQYAKDVYGQTDTEKDKAKELKDKHDVEKFAEENRIRDERTGEATRRMRVATTEEERRAAIQYKKDIDYRNKNKLFKDDEYSEEFRNGIKAEYEKYAKAGERRQEEFAKRLDKTANIMTAAGGVVGAVTGGLVGGVHGGVLGAGIGSGLGMGNKAAARKIREDSKGPSKEKKLADAYKAIADTETDAETPTAPSAPPPAAPSAPPPATPSNP